MFLSSSNDQFHMAYDHLGKWHCATLRGSERHLGNPVEVTADERGPRLEHTAGDSGLAGALLVAVVAAIDDASGCA
jgi:hypothetical protein